MKTVLRRTSNESYDIDPDKSSKATDSSKSPVQIKTMTTTRRVTQCTQLFKLGFDDGKKQI